MIKPVIRPGSGRFYFGGLPWEQPSAELRQFRARRGSAGPAAYDPPVPNRDRSATNRMPAARTWIIVALSLACLVLAHLAFTGRVAGAAAAAVGLLAVLVSLAFRGPRRWWWRCLALLVGAVLAVMVARGLPPWPLLLPPVLIPASIAITFGRSLRAGRTALVERVVRGFHAPQVPDAASLAYARKVTWGWTVLLAGLALANAWLAAHLSPGGMLELLGLAPRWPVPPDTFAWFSNTGTYLLIGAMFVAELALRAWLLPHDRFRNPLRFLREARTRLPGILRELRHG